MIPEPISRTPESPLDLRGWNLTIESRLHGDFEFQASEFVSQPEWSTSLEWYAVPRLHWVRGGECLVRLRRSQNSDEFLLKMRQESGSAVVMLRLLVGEEVVMEWRGALYSVLESEGLLVLKGVMSWPGADRPLCRDARTFGGVGWLPQVFGDGLVQGVGLFQLKEAVLAMPLEADGTELTLRGSVDWPSSGRVQIQEEIFVYTGFEGPTNLLGVDDCVLSRTEAKAHPAGSRVVLLPGDHLQWCLADHECDVVWLRAGSSDDGNLLPMDTIDEVALGGRDATIYTLDRLPLLLRHGWNEVAKVLGRDPLKWSIRVGNTVLDPLDAVDHQAPERGTPFNTTRRILDLAYVGEDRADNSRFDLIESAVLALEISDSPAWPEDTRFRVTVAKGDDSLEVEFSRSGLLQEFPVAVESDESLPRPAAPTREDVRRTYFQILEEDGDWTDAIHAIDPRLHVVASHSGVADGTLTPAFVDMTPEDSASVFRLDFVARVRNTGSGTGGVELSCDIGLESPSTESFSIPEGEERLCRMEVTLPPSYTHSDIFHAFSVYTLTALEGASIEIEFLWLERHCRYTLPDTAATLTLPLIATATAPGVYIPVRIPIAPLVEELGWDLFLPGGAPVTVTIELLDPPASALWVVYLRNLHWALQLRPATSVQPTDIIIAMVQGRHRRTGGTANPATVLRTLLESDDFAGAGSERIDDASFAGAETVCDGRNLSVARGFQEWKTVGDALAELSAEALLIPIEALDGWRMDVLPLIPRRALQAAVPLHEQRLSQRELLRSGFAEGGILLIDQRGDISSSGDGASQSVEMEWVRSDSSAVVEAVTARIPPEREAVRLLVDPAWITMIPGVLLARQLAGNRLQQGMVNRVSWRSGELTVELAGASDHQRINPGGGFVLDHCTVRKSLLAYHDGIVLMELHDDGKLSLAGVVYPFFSGAGPEAEAIVYSSLQNALVFSCLGGEEDAYMILTPAGDLLVSTAVYTESDGGVVIGGFPATIGDGVLALGNPGGAAPMVLLEDGLHVAGELFENVEGM